ncbi:MAG: hypothetical protein JXR60_00045 [Bacteroidales bacterium]|nr:hypothetical protein [Bacteroidales bacterium]
MNKKISIVVLFSVIAAILITIAYFSFFRSPKVLSANLKAVSPNTAFVVEIKDYYDFVETLNQNTSFWSELINVEPFSKWQAELQKTDSLFKQFTELDVLLKKKPVLLTLSLMGKHSLIPTYIVEMDELSSESAIIEWLSVNYGEASIKSKAYQNTKIWTIEKNGISVSMALYQGLWIASTSDIQVEESVRQIDQSTSVLDDESFVKVHKTAGEHVDANIYIHYQGIDKLWTQYINPNYQSDFKQIKYIADWSELDVNFSKNQVLLNGFTYANDSVNNYLNVFRGQKSATLKIDQVLPSNTSFYMAFELFNFDAFQNRQNQFNDRKGQGESYQKWFDNFKEAHQIDWFKVFPEIINGEVVLAQTLVNPLDLNQNTFLILETHGESPTMELLMPMLEQMANKQGVELNTLYTDYAVKDDKTQRIYPFPENDFAERWLGRMFSNAKSKYFTFIDDYLVFGSSVKDLKRFIDDNERQSTLENDSFYKDLMAELSSESGLLCYSNINRSEHLFNLFFSKEVADPIAKNFEQLKKFQAVVIQINPSDELFYANLYLKYNPVIKEKPRTVWESKLDTLLGIKPKIVTNHRNNQKEIFVQDVNNTVYLINRNGKVLWRQNIGESIQSEVYQIDYYRNNKLQYLFNTKNKIHIIDRDGNNVEHFPINLRAEATAGISVFDYDGSRDYRFFIPCKDKNIYVYDIEGKLLKGWDFKGAEAIVKTEIQHFRIGETDYILASDKNRIYILNRKGEEKIKLDKAVIKSENNPFFLTYKDNLPYFTSTSPDGQVFMINPEGQVWLKEGLKVSPNHYVQIADLNNNQIFDLVYTDGGNLKILYDLKNPFNYEFEAEVSAPILFSFSSNITKIGVTDFEHQLIYLFNENGTLYKDFPLRGTSMFSISLFSSESSKFNLVTAGSDGFLYNYEVP